MPDEIISIEPSDDVFKKLAIQMEKTPKRLEKALKKTLNTTSKEVKTRLASESTPAVKKPIQWETPKQKRAFFATDGFGQGIPTRRTNKLKNSWRFRVFSSSGTLNIGVTLTNIAPYGRFVIGDNQQKMHSNTGWQKAELSVAKQIPLYNKAVEKTYFEVADFTEDIL